MEYSHLSADIVLDMIKMLFLQKFDAFFGFFLFICYLLASECIGQIC